jgi:hypothetical protein
MFRKRKATSKREPRQHNRGHVRHDTEPGTSFWQRVEVWLMSMLPIVWLL